MDDKIALELEKLWYEYGGVTSAKLKDAENTNLGKDKPKPLTSQRITTSLDRIDAEKRKLEDEVSLLKARLKKAEAEAVDERKKYKELKKASLSEKLNSGMEWWKLNDKKLKRYKRKVAGAAAAPVNESVKPQNFDRTAEIQTPVRDSFIIGSLLLFFLGSFGWSGWRIYNTVRDYRRGTAIEKSINERKELYDELGARFDENVKLREEARTKALDERTRMYSEMEVRYEERMKAKNATAENAHERKEPRKIIAPVPERKKLEESYEKTAEQPSEPEDPTMPKTIEEGVARIEAKIGAGLAKAFDEEKTAEEPTPAVKVKEEPAVDKPQPASGSYKRDNLENVILQELTDSYLIKGIPYNGKIASFEWSKERARLDYNEELRTNPSGDRFNVLNWIKNMNESGWQIPDTRGYYATLAALYRNRNGPYAEIIEKLRGMFANDFEERMITSTTVKYRGGSDKVIHGYGYPQQHEIGSGKFTKQGFVVTAEDGAYKANADLLRYFFGTVDAKEAEEVFNWLTGLKAHFSFLPEQYQRDDIHVSIWNFSGEHLEIDAGDLIMEETYYTRGVRIIEQ